MKKNVFACLALLVFLAGCAHGGSNNKKGGTVPKEPKYYPVKTMVDSGSRKVSLVSWDRGSLSALMYERSEYRIFFYLGYRETTYRSVKMPSKGEVFDAKGNPLCSAEISSHNEDGIIKVEEKCTGRPVFFNLSDGGKIRGLKGHFDFWPVNTDKIVNQN